MAVQRLVSIVAGKFTEYVATVISGGASSAGQIAALDPTGRLDNSVMPVGIGADTASIVASEAISAGALVNVWSNAGTQNVRNADASTAGKEANGFVTAAVGSGANATVYFSGQDNVLSGLTPGPIYLSDTAVGTVTSTPPTATGHVLQRVGTAVSPTSLEFRPSDPVTRA